MVQAVKHWRHYLFHREFILYADQKALKHLHSQDKISSRHASWVAYLERFTFVVKHKSDITNRVANALSKRRNLLNKLHVEVLGFHSFADFLKIDPYFSEILAKVRAGEKSEYFLQDDFLFRGNQLCILDCSLLPLVIKELHGDW